MILIKNKPSLEDFFDRPAKPNNSINTSTKDKLVEFSNDKIVEKINNFFEQNDLSTVKIGEWDFTGVLRTANENYNISLSSTDNIITKKESYIETIDNFNVSFQFASNMIINWNSLSSNPLICNKIKDEYTDNCINIIGNRSENAKRLEEEKAVKLTP